MIFPMVRNREILQVYNNNLSHAKKAFLPFLTYHADRIARLQRAVIPVCIIPCLCVFTFCDLQIELSI